MHKHDDSGSLSVINLSEDHIILLINQVLRSYWLGRLRVIYDNLLFFTQILICIMLPFFSWLLYMDMITYPVPDPRSGWENLC